MKIKSLNILLLCVFLGFSVFFGWKNYSTNTNLANSDKLFETQLSESLNQISKEIANDINITNINNAKNQSSSTAPTPGGSNAEVNFTSFHQMYTYAVNKYNRATNIYSVGTGTAVLSGSVDSLGMKIENEKTVLSITKVKKQNERLFKFALNGRKIIEGMNNLAITSDHYTNGTLYEYKLGGDQLIQLTQTDYINKLNWNMTEIFHLPTAESAAAVTDAEIISFIFDPSTKEYTAKLELNPNRFKSNFASVIQNITNSTKPATISKISMLIKVDKSGNFKTITFSETVSSAMKVSGLSVQGTVETNYTESFISIDGAPVDITRPF